MIKCHLSRLMGEKKVRVAEVARETGLHRNTITLLYKETATQVDLETIERLCNFFECLVGDLFEYLPTPPSKADDSAKTVVTGSDPGKKAR